MEENLKIISNYISETINSKNGIDLNNYILDLLDIVGEESEYSILEGEETISYDIRSENEKLDLLESVYAGIKYDEDKEIFINNIMGKERILGTKIVNAFASKILKEEAKVEEEVLDAIIEEPTIEDTKESVIDITDTPSDEFVEKIDNSEENIEEENHIEEIEKEKEEGIIYEEELEGPAITEYKQKTIEKEKDLEILLAKIEGIVEETTKMDEIINNTSYPEIEELEIKVEKVIEEIKVLEQDIVNITEEKEKYDKLKTEYTSFYEEQAIPKTQGDYIEKMDIYNQRINYCETSILLNNQKKINKEKELEMLNNKILETRGPLYRIEVWEFAEIFNKEVANLESKLIELKEIEQNLYKESKGIPLEIYGMQTKIENQINDMKQTYDSVIGIRSEINLNDPQLKPVLDAIKAARNINNEINEELNENFREKEKEDINKLKEEIELRKENIAKYYEVLGDINKLNEDLKNGKIKDNLIDELNPIYSKINSISDEKLREELDNKLNNILEKTKEKEPLPAPEPKKGKWKKKLKVVGKKVLNWIKEHKLAAIGIGLALTTVICYATMPVVQMMINSCLWNVGKALGWSSGTLGNLHNANLGLSTIAGGGKYAFEAASGMYTLGGAAGAQALYNSAGAGLVTTLMGFGAVGGLAGIVATIKDRIQNRKKKNKPEEVVPKKEVDKTQPEETVEKTKGEEFTPEQKEKIQMMINEAVQTSISKVKNDLVQNMVNAGLTQEQIAAIINGNPTVSEEMQPETVGMKK